MTRTTVPGPEGGTPVGDAGGPPAADASTGELITRLSEQSSRLVRDELALARAEINQKIKRIGTGAGMFGAAGLLAFFGLATMIATAIIALALVLETWLASLIVMVVLFAIAGIPALVGRKQVAAGAPPTPDRAAESIRRDVETVKERAHHDPS